MKKTVLTFGIISGCISAIMFVFFALTQKGSDFSSSYITGYVTILLSLSLVYFGIRSYRNRYLNGSITFGQAFLTGIYITLLSCFIYVIAWIMVYHTLIPDFMDRYATYTIEKAKSSGDSQEQIDKVIARMEKSKEMYRNPIIMAGFTFLEPFPVGLVVTLISAFLLRKKREEPVTG